MAIVRKKAVAAEPSAEAFIDSAPDGRKAIKTVGRKSIISVSIAPEMLTKVDAWAKARGMSRVAAISFAISNLD